MLNYKMYQKKALLVTPQNPGGVGYHLLVDLMLVKNKVNHHINIIQLSRQLYMMILVVYSNKIHQQKVCNKRNL